MPKVELKPCPNPWCRRKFPPKAYRHIGSTTRYVHCDDCGMDGPTADTEAEAIAAWNTRPEASLSSMVALDEELETQHPGWMTGSPDRAIIESRGRWCVFPCQKIGPDGQKLKRMCRVPVADFDGAMWTNSGTREAPTLTPSIDCQSKPCWHGLIVDGEVRP